MSTDRRPAMLCLALLALWGTVAHAQNQFGTFVAPPYTLDNVQGEMVNLETQAIKPILVTGDSRFVVVANIPDNRLQVFDPPLANLLAEVVLGQGISVIAENPFTDVAELWVSVRHQSAIMIVDVNTWRVTNVIRPPIAATAVGAGNADTPGGIAFAQGKAFVAASSSDTLEVFDAVTKAYITSIPLQRPHNQLTPSLARPYAVVADPTPPETVHVLSLVSGNQSGPFLNTAGPVDFVLDLTAINGFSLPDFDIVSVDAATNTVTGHTTGVGTTLLGMALHPTTGQLIVANVDSQNGKFIGENSFTNGKITFNRLTYVGMGGAAHNPVVLDPPTTTAPVVMPTDVVTDGFGRVIVAGYASSNIGVFDSAGAFLGIFNTGAGPRGLAVDTNTGTLYCLNRADNSVWAFDVSLPGTLPPAPIFQTNLTDPTYDRIRDGRKVFLDATHSADGTTGCFSCHPDARKDGLTWELSKFFETTEQHTNQNPPTWKDRKGPMVTQDLRSIEEVPPYHWRGEQLDLEAFNGVFPDLLKGTSLSATDFQLMKDYVFSTVYPPNPLQQMNRNFTPSAVQGVFNFQTLNSDGSAQNPRTCEDCHALPTGTDSSITDVFIFTPQSPAVVKTAQLRGMWTKTFSLANADDNPANPPNFALGSSTVLPMTGTGFFHSGIIDNTAEFIDAFFGGLLVQQRTDLKQFMNEYDSGLAPATMYSEYLDRNSVGLTQVPYMIDQANNSNCDLVAVGRLRLLGVWVNVSLLWDAAPGNQFFRPDLTSLGTFTWPRIQTLATNGNAELLILGTPHWSGERIALDRDRDGVFNGDELAFAGGPLNPTNPDTDGDGMWDGYDPQPLQNPNTILIVGAPTPSIPTEVYDTTNSVKLTYTTNQLSPTRVEYGLTTAYGQFEGDPFPLPLNPPAQRSNLWKRKHTVFLRLLRDGQPYQFRIHTQGQNGQTAVTPNMSTAMFLADEFTPNVRVSSITVFGLRSGTQVTYVADVTVVDNAGNPVNIASVHARLTTYNGLNLGTQIVQQAFTTVSGIARFVYPPVTQTAGDKVVVDVPMTTVNSGGGPVAGVVDVNGNTFAWPEGPSMTMINAP